MRAKMLLDGDPPKVSPKELTDVLRRAGIEVVEKNADFGVVVGGDGRFSKYGRTESIPLLFVGVRSNTATGSKAFLAETTFDELPGVLSRIVKKEYSVIEDRRLEVFLNNASKGEVFTDVYLGRGVESTCLRYRVSVASRGAKFEEAAVSDGMVVATSAGSTGYYSYPDRIRGEMMDPDAFAKIGEDEIGVCHINPTYTERSGSKRHPMRYTLPWGSRVEVELFREARARVYGAEGGRRGFRMAIGDRVLVAPGRSVTRLISVPRDLP